MRVVIIFCVLISFAMASASTEDHKQLDNGFQHRTISRYQSQGRTVQHTFNDDDRNLNQYDYRYSQNDIDQRSYGSLVVPPGFKQTESVFHILFVRNKT